MFTFSEYEDKIKRLIPILAFVSIALAAGILIFFLASKLLAPPSTVADFRLELNRTRVEVVQGRAFSVLITLVPEGSFYGDVFLEIRKPENMSSSISKSILNPSSNTAVLTIDTSNVAPGSHRVEISGSYLEVKRGAVLIVSVKEADKPFFKANASVHPSIIMQMESFFINVSITPYAGFNENVSVKINNLPCSQIRENLINRGAYNSQITVYTSRNTPAGVNNFSLVLSSTSYSISLNLTITILEAPPPSFQLYFYPNITIVKPGDTVKLSVKVKPFYGFNESIRVYSSFTSLILKEFNGSNLWLAPNNYTGITILMKLDENITSGIYDLNFVVDAPSLRDSKTVKIGVANVSSNFKDPIPAIVISKKVVDAAPGQDVVLNVLVGSLNGFEGEVIPRVVGKPIGDFYFSTGEGFPKIGVSIQRLNLTAGEAKFLLLRVMVYSGLTSGIYRINVELCTEHIPPKMSFPVLRAMSGFIVEFRIR